MHHEDLAHVRRLADAFAKMVQADLGMRVRIGFSDERLKLGVLVSKIPHCLHELIYRWQVGELKGDLACVVSNHRDLEPLAEAAKVPFHYVPVPRENRAASEAEQLEILHRYGVELVSAKRRAAPKLSTKLLLLTPLICAPPRQGPLDRPSTRVTGWSSVELAR
jgi:formyltetrahydrofolate hydrolase